MIIKFIIIIALTFVVVTMIGEEILIDSDSIFGATSNTSAKGGLLGIQNNQDDIPTWIIHGVYRMDKMNSTSPMFNATFYMMKLNGSEAHTHQYQTLN